MDTKINNQYLDSMEQRLTILRAELDNIKADLRYKDQALEVIKNFTSDPWAEHVADVALNGGDLDEAVAKQHWNKYEGWI